MARIIYQQERLISIFVVYEIRGMFHELNMRKAVRVAIEKYTLNFVMEGIFEDSSESRDLASQYKYSGEMWTFREYTSSFVCRSSHALSQDTRRHLTFL